MGPHRIPDNELQAVYKMIKKQALPIRGLGIEPWGAGERVENEMPVVYLEKSARKDVLRLIEAHKNMKWPGSVMSRWGVLGTTTHAEVVLQLVFDGPGAAVSFNLMFALYVPGTNLWLAIADQMKEIVISADDPAHSDRVEGLVVELAGTPLNVIRSFYEKEK